MNADLQPNDTGTDAGKGRFTTLIAAVVIGVALFGFLAGIREPAATSRPAPLEVPVVAAVSHAPSYAELAVQKREASATLLDLKFAKPGIFDPVTRTDDMKLAALADRARNRAYDGAPPTVPHAIDGQTTASCLACHLEGLRIDDRVASRMSHAVLSNCTQCHVEQVRSGLPFRTDEPQNSFVGVYRAGPGTRAAPGAPPTIPHHTWLRENCNSCHGLLTRPGTRTTHPWLTNCLQCHAPSAALDQVDFSERTR